MHLWFWIWLGVVLKVPVAGLCYFIYRVANDTPDQVLGEDDGGNGIVYKPGPRSRGPHGGDKTRRGTARRGDAGHADAPKPRVRDHAVRGE